MDNQDNNEDKEKDNTENPDERRIEPKMTMEASAYDELMREFRRKRDSLTEISDELEGLANEYRRDTAITRFSRGLRSYTMITRDAFTKLEDLYRANSTLKTQIEILKEMLLSLSEIRDNETFKQRIQKEFTDKHNVPYKPTD